MIFDKLCGVVERHFPEFIPTLENANIFEFVGIPHDILPRIMKGKDDDYFDEIFKGFFLPYPVTAIEDKASCIILIDRYENQTGMDGKRFFIEAMLPGVDNSDYFNDEKMTRDLLKDLKQNIHISTKYISFSYGYLNFDQETSTKKVYGVNGKVTGCHFASKKEIIYRDIQNNLDLEKITKATLQNVATAVEEVLFFNQPDKFILQRRNVKAKKVPKNKIARSHQRPIYTLLHPAQIRSKLGITNPSGEQTRKTPHERRRHRRYLSDERYATDENGAAIAPKIIPAGPRRGEHYYKSVDIPATWIGDSEKIIGNKRYKVILDR